MRRLIEPLDVRLALAADINGDFSVDVFDVAEISNAWGAVSGPADANGDGSTDIFDVAMVSNAWRPRETPHEHLLLQLDASNPNALVADEAVSQWADEQGGRMFTQPDAGWRPHLVDTAHGPGMLFQPPAPLTAGQYLSAPASPVALGENAGAIIIAATLPENYWNGGFSVLFNGSTSTTGSGYFFLETYPVDVNGNFDRNGEPVLRVRWRDGSFNIDLRGHTRLVAGESYVFSLVARGNGLGYELRVNGETQTVYGNHWGYEGVWFDDVAGLDTLSLGALVRDDGPSDFADSILHEVRVYSSGLSAAALHAQELALMAKWRLAQ